MFCAFLSLLLRFFWVLVVSNVVVVPLNLLIFKNFQRAFQSILAYQSDPLTVQHPLGRREFAGGDEGGAGEQEPRRRFCAFSPQLTQTRVAPVGTYLSLLFLFFSLAFYYYYYYYYYFTFHSQTAQVISAFFMCD